MNQPTIGGLALPPKMPTELTQAMPLAKAGPVRNTAGNGNKWAFDAYRPIVASDSPATAQYVALPKGSSLRQMLNPPLLEETESDWWQQTLFEYLAT